MNSIGKTAAHRAGVFAVALAAVVGCAGCGTVEPVATMSVLPNATDQPPTTAPVAPGSGGAVAPGVEVVAPPGAGAGSSAAQVAAANRMTADNVGMFCKQTGELGSWGAPAEIGSPANFKYAVEILIPLKPHTPAALMADVNLLQTDYQAVADQRRVFVQIKDEVEPAYARVMDFRRTLCDVG